MVMLRPATPLSILYGIAFVLLLLSTISVPIVKSIQLASHKGTSYGVFGICTATGCTSPKLGYTLVDATQPLEPQFALSSEARHALSSILVVHPVACFMCLICLVMALAAHFHKPSHSAGFLLALLIFSFPTLLVTLLAFLVDILLFIPHMGWGGWIVLGATILIMACALLTCAMRRTVVSREARLMRLEGNKEMNGENARENQFMAHQQYEQEQYSRKMQGMDVAQTAILPQPSAQDDLAEAHSPPPSPPNGFAHTKNTPYAAGYAYGGSQRSLNNDRPPLNASPYGQAGAAGMTDPAAGLPRDRSGTRSGQRTPRRSEDSQRSGNPPPFYGGRGRGGYPPRGGFGLRGGMYGTYPPPPGMYPPPPGMYAPRGAFRGGPRGPPPPGWPGAGRGPPMSAGGVAAGMMMMGRGPRGQGPPPGYENRYFDNGAERGAYGSPHDMAYGEMSPYADHDAGARGDAVNGEPVEGAGYGFDANGATSRSQSGSRTPGGRAASHNAPIGVAVEMDDSANGATPNGYGHGAEVAGQDSHAMYGTDGIWTSEPAELGLSSPPSQFAHPAGIAELRSTASPLHQAESARSASRNTAQHTRSASGNYYEDVDPRFAEPEEHESVTHTILSEDHDMAEPEGVPTALRPGLGQMQMESSSALFPSSYATPDEIPPSHPALNPHSNDPYTHNFDPNGSHDQLAHDESSRNFSPPESEASEYTSISQRGINPAWRPGPGDPMYYGPPQSGYGPGPRRAAPPPTAGVLDENPDFSLPGAGPSRLRASSRAQSSAAGSARGTVMGSGVGSVSGGPYPAI